MDDKEIRRKFKANLLRSASIPDPKIFYARRENECICIEGHNPFSHKFVILPHPDVTLKEFFSSC